MTFGRVYSSSRSGRRFMTKEGKEYKELISLYAKNFIHLRGLHEPLKFTYIVHGPWLTKDGLISKTLGDLDGFSKLLIDATCEALEINDSCITEIVAQKRMANDWLLEFSISKLEATTFYALKQGQRETNPS